MVVAAAICGAVAYTVTFHLELDSAHQTYESLSSTALEQAQAIAKRKQQGGKVLSTVLGYAFPDADQWPFVGLSGYHVIATEVAKQSSTRGHGFATLVRPDQVGQFEQHARELFEREGYPDTAGVSDFGFGLYGNDDSYGYEDGRFHDTTGNTTWNSPRTVLAPFLQHKNAVTNPDLLLMNLHHEEFRGLVLDNIMDCSDEAAARAARNDTVRDGSAAASTPSCGVVTDFTEIFVQPGPAAVFFHPIYPVSDPTTVVGFIGTSIVWEEVLKHTVPDYVGGLDAVICNADDVCFTYSIDNGIPTLSGDGDLHDPAYDSYGRKVVLHDTDTGATLSREYTLTLYPTEQMFDSFHSGSPIYIAVAFVFVIFFCTLIFFLYDYFMKSESHRRKEILDVKRRFVRFISHEVRTPLNVVCMGLELLQSELASQCGKDQLTKRNHQALEHAPSSLSSPGVARNAGASAAATFAAPAAPSREVEADQRQSQYWFDLTGDILENTQNAVSVLNDLLNYDKIESGTFKVDVRRVSIWRLVRKTVSEFAIQARNRRIELGLTVQQERDMPTGDDRDDVEEARERDLRNLQVVGDDIRLTQVIRNLVSNALKFSPEDGHVKVTATYVPNGKVSALGRSKKKRGKCRKCCAPVCCCRPWMGGRGGKGSFDEDDGPSELALAYGNKSAATREALESPRSGLVRIRVSDDGVGLTQEQLGLLFNEGVQFDPNRLQKGGGSGLGLSITREIVHQHGGAIWAESDGRGLGSTFVIELPLHQFEFYEDGGAAKQPGADADGCVLSSTDTASCVDGFSDTSCGFGSEPCRRSHHILVVDDVISNTKMLVRLLERNGHTCVVSHNGQEAIDEYAKNKAAVDQEAARRKTHDDDDSESDRATAAVRAFDTILMDFEMPVMKYVRPQ